MRWRQRWVREIPREWCKQKSEQSTHVVYHLIRCLWWWRICVCVCVPTCSLSVAVTNVTCKQNHSLSFYGLLYFSETVALSVSPDSTANLTTGLLATAGRTELVVLVLWWLLRIEALLGKPFINVITSLSIGRKLFTR